MAVGGYETASGVRNAGRVICRGYVAEGQREPRTAPARNRQMSGLRDLCMGSGHRDRTGSLVLLILALCFLPAAIGPGSAHAPLSAGSGEGIDTALLISSPEKSFVLYTALPRGSEAQYYRFPMEAGQVLSGSIMVPGPGTMVPDLAIICPGITPSGDLPPFLTVPPGSAAMVIRGQAPEQPSYEPFTPQPVYEVARFSVPVAENGSCYIAVFGSTGGKYSLAPGFREEFTPAEWLLIPWSVIAIHLWEGQHPLMILAPMIIVLAGGSAALWFLQKRRGLRITPVRLLVLAAGLLFIGGAAMTALQIIHTVSATGYDPGVFLTLFFTGIPFALGLAALQAGRRDAGPDSSRRTGMTLIVVGLLGLLFWGGLIIGPVLALTGGIVLTAGHGYPHRATT